MASVCEAAGGEAGMRALAAAWHERVMADDVVAHAFSHGFRDDHVDRLAAYLTEALGGAPVYSARYGGESFVVREHSGNGPHDEMNVRAVACFDGALRACGLEGRLGEVLHDYFAWATTSVNRFERSAVDVPDGLEIPHWSWDGRVHEAGGL